ncbi:MAG TPA: hypothetical protein VIO61_12120 [Anaerolineaceae bacterium]
MIKIGIVGPCAAGKSTLIRELKNIGVDARHIAQEHSGVKDMWQRLVHPDLLVFLDASFEETVRRKSLNWREGEYEEQQRRLAHARDHADLYIFTDGLTVKQVLDRILAMIDQHHANNFNTR